jgi:hypothetical protein
MVKTFSFFINESLGKFNIDFLQEFEDIGFKVLVEDAYFYKDSDGDLYSSVSPQLNDEYKGKKVTLRFEKLNLNVDEFIFLYKQTIEILSILKERIDYNFSIDITDFNLNIFQEKVDNSDKKKLIEDVVKALENYLNKKQVDDRPEITVDGNRIVIFPLFDTSSTRAFLRKTEIKKLLINISPDYQVLSNKASYRRRDTTYAIQVNRLSIHF